jgi:hypothetical protein
MGVQGTLRTRLQHLQRLLHSIDEVFRPVDDLDDPIHNHVPSIKKLLKGDAYLDMLKIVLGWILDTLKGMIELPPHQKQRLREIFEYLLHQTRVGTNTWQKILGELHSMAIGIPGSQGLFSMLHKV